MKSSHCTRSVLLKPFSKTKLKKGKQNWRVQKQTLKVFCKKGVSGGISHVFLEVFHRCFTCVFSKVCLNFKNTFFLEQLSNAAWVVLSTNTKDYYGWLWFGKVIFAFRILFLLLFPSLIFYLEILQQFDQIYRSSSLLPSCDSLQDCKNLAIRIFWLENQASSCDTRLDCCNLFLLCFFGTLSGDGTSVEMLEIASLGLTLSSRK